MWVVAAGHEDVEGLVMFGPFLDRQEALRVAYHADIHDGWWAWAYRAWAGCEVEQVLTAEIERAVGMPDFRL